MTRFDISVIIRVYDRMSDLIVCVECVKKHWNNNNYHLIIVSNGKSNGFEIPEIVKNTADCVIELEKNSGHLKGNSQLLLAGIERVPTSSRYIIILEADTWIFSDELINKYIMKLEDSDSVWASSEWVKKYWSLGLDFAIVRTDFVIANMNMFNFGKNPEAQVCNYLLDTNNSFLYIKENMPVHIPKSMRKLIPDKFGGRFRSFPLSKMVTHHIEELENGINTKKLLANYCLGKRVFPMGNSVLIKLAFYKFLLLRFISIISPQSSWLKKKKKVLVNQ